jgi:hypothetical protein
MRGVSPEVKAIDCRVIRDHQVDAACDAIGHVLDAVTSAGSGRATTPPALSL